MSSINVAFCKALIDENHRIAAHFKAQADAAIADIDSITDEKRRLRVKELAELFGQLAIEHAQIARRQEIDLGYKCHCPHLPI